MRPHQESQDGDGDARQGHELITEDALAREATDKFADHSHRRQDHDVHRRMGVEPEQVLEQERVSAEPGVEDAEMEEALHGHEHDGDGDYRRAENHDQAGRVVGPDEQGQAAPGKAGGAHAVDGDDEVQSGENRGEPGNEDRESGLDYLGVGVLRAEWAVESPARIHAAGQHDVCH